MINWEEIKNIYLTWKTGKTKIQRDWEAWRDVTIIHNAHTIENYYANFKHIIELDPAKVWNQYEPFGWVPVAEFRQYEYPNRPLGANAVVNWFRGARNQWDGRFHIDECFGSDHVFAATNNEQDAIMIAFLFS